MISEHCNFFLQTLDIICYAFIKYLSYQGPAKIDKFEQKYAIVKTLL